MTISRQCAYSIRQRHTVCDADELLLSKLTTRTFPLAGHLFCFKTRGKFSRTKFPSCRLL